MLAAPDNVEQVSCEGGPNCVLAPRYHFQGTPRPDGGGRAGETPRPYSQWVDRVSATKRNCNGDSGERFRLVRLRGTSRPWRRQKDRLRTGPLDPGDMLITLYILAPCGRVRISVAVPSVSAGGLQDDPHAR